MHQLKEKESLGGLGECSQMFFVLFFLGKRLLPSLLLANVVRDSLGCCDGFLAEPLLDEEHELFLALVSHFHVFNQLAELHEAVVSQ